MKQSIKIISEKLKKNSNKLPFHSEYWRVIINHKNKSNICIEYNTKEYNSIEYYKPISFIPNVNE